MYKSSSNSKELELDYTHTHFKTEESAQELLNKIESYMFQSLLRLNIKNQIDFSLPQGINNQEDFDQLLWDNVFCKKVILKTTLQKNPAFDRDYLAFDFTETKISLAQIQVFVFIVVEMIQREFATKNFHLIPANLVLPKGFSSWDDLYNSLNQYGNSTSFLEIKTNMWGNLDYFPVQSKYPYPSAKLFLGNSVLQEIYESLKDHNIEWNSRNICSLSYNITAYFTLANSCISTFYIQMAQYTGTPIPCKTCPTFIDFERNRYINFMLPTLVENKDSGISKKIFKSLLLEYACCCRYISFWCGLFNIISCPAINLYTRKRFLCLMEYLLSIKENVYLHHIFIESNPVDHACPIEKRGQKENTTRLKLYFTFEDGKPWLARFDLPHVDVPYLHINLSDENGEPKDGALSEPLKTFNAERLSHIKIGKADDSEDVLKILEDTFVSTDFSDDGALQRHAPKDIDKEMLNRVVLERAYFLIAEMELTYSKIKDKSDQEEFEKEFYAKLSSDVREIITSAEEILRTKIQENGKEYNALNIHEIFDLLYESVIGEYQKGCANV